MAGKGTEVGRSFEELARIIDGVGHDELLGVCLDTCHVADAGYDIVGDLDGVLDEFDRVIGLDRLRALHLNDSKNPLGSHKDRHERIGAGALGLETFRAVVTSPRLAGLPMVLETPAARARRLGRGDRPAPQARGEGVRGGRPSRHPRRASAVR